LDSARSTRPTVRQDERRRLRRRERAENGDGQLQRAVAWTFAHPVHDQIPTLQVDGTRPCARFDPTLGALEAGNRLWRPSLTDAPRQRDTNRCKDKERAARANYVDPRWGRGETTGADQSNVVVTCTCSAMAPLGPRPANRAFSGDSSSLLPNGSRRQRQARVRPRSV
jgi:hypothetical protein